MKEHGGSEGAESPSYWREEQKANRRLNPHNRHNDRIRRVISPRPSEGVCTLRPGPTPRRTPRRPIKVLGFKSWPTNGFTTAPGHHQSKGRGWMGPIAASTRAHKRHRHPDPRSSLD
jgi:hypothetical protein